MIGGGAGSVADGVTIDPPAGAWGSLVRRARDGRGERFREQLGIEASRAVLMTGHQADWWHPGVLAKQIAVDVAARRLGAAPVWLWVDQDANDPGVLRYPAAGEAGGVAEGAWRIDPGAATPPETPTGMRPALEPGEPPRDVHAGVAEGALQRVGDALRAHAGASSLARQMAGALVDLASGVAPGPGAHVFATELAGTDLFGEVVARMADDPGACAAAYNEAARAHPEAGLRALTHRDGRVELPLWRVRAGEPRLPVFARALGDVPREELAPRGLLMSGLMRLGGCELFVHGTGGGVYAPVTERWLGSWLGAEVAPVSVVTATRRLDLASGDVPRAAEVAAARQRAHTARHNPELLGDDEAARVKRGHLERIRSLRASGGDARGAFRAMHDDLEAYRRARAAALSALDAEAARLGSLAGSRALIEDRTWAFALFPDAALRGLRAEVEGAFAGA